jgi:hypothetical protein
VRGFGIPPFMAVVVFVSCVHDQVMPTRPQQLGLVILLLAFAAFVLFRLRG